MGVLRSFKPTLPLWFYYASALTNVLLGGVIIMLWVGLFTGDLDKEAWFVPFLVVPVYLIILKGLRIGEFFTPQRWFIVTVIFCTALGFVIPIAFLVWIPFLFVGFWRPFNQRRSQWRLVENPYEAEYRKNYK
jgi:hypothetical protein